MKIFIPLTFLALISAAEAFEVDLKSIKLPSPVDCDKNIQAINLEATESFLGIERDFQDETNACYAVTTRNLIIGATKGKVQPSYLDLALQYKKVDVSLGKPEDEGLGWGSSPCAVIERANEVGTCDQVFSAFERGEQNELIEKLGISHASAKAEVIKLFTHFNKNINEIKKVNPGFYQKFTSNLVGMLSELESLSAKTNITKFEFKSELDQKDLSKLDDKVAGVIEKTYSALLPSLNIQISKALISGRDQKSVFEMFEKLAGPVFLPGNALLFEKEKSKVKSYIQKTYNDELKNVMSSYLKILNPDARDLDPEKLASLCDQSFLENGFHYLNELRQFALYLKNYPEISKRIQSSDMPVWDVLQLLIAPNCADPKQRIILSPKITCTPLYKSSLKLLNVENTDQIWRSKIYEELKKGLPVGQHLSNHINTIVGYRFNPKKNECEVLIRESIDGKSHWFSESNHFHKIDVLYTVSPSN